MFSFLSLMGIVFLFSHGKGEIPLPCAPELVHSSFMYDLVTACEHVSWDELGFQGKSDYYYAIKTISMNQFDTRMRIYTNEEDAIIVFRPTQSTPEGGSIHNNRYMSPTTFLHNTTYDVGSVHNHFQEAFIGMMIQANDVMPTLASKRVYVTGHSLGGAFSLFMAASLVYDYHIIPKGVYGLAGPFIGDKEYRHKVQDPLHNLFPMWLIETVDQYNPGNRDGTSEGYQTFDNRLSIDPSMICGFYITPLGPGQSYGMHDLKNYALAVQ